MSLSAGSRCHSPISSGRSSPQLRRRVDEDITKRDPKYKRFSTSIDRALALFESNNLQEWADYISFLGRLLKALQSHPSLPLIPSKSIVAQRLAQCLNPRLPSGVHQKTIEVYSYIFSLIGHDGLVADLPLWTPGLTPVLSYASLTLKPHYLCLLEKFYLPLGACLRPALKSLILALLPGIDEEGGEYFDRTFALIEGIQKGMGDDAYFWQCLLLATITSPVRRQGALAFLTRKLPTLSKLENKITTGTLDKVNEKGEEIKTEVEALINPEPGLLIRALCGGLLDEQLLVQRGFLDLLVTNSPLSSPVLQDRISKLDLQLLVISAVGVVMRRDMGLNRRLWAWLLGTNELNLKLYFELYGLQALVGGLMNMLKFRPDASSAERARPYRICLSLMDRWEIGSLIVPKLFFTAIESIQAYETEAISKELYAEVFRSASMFFDAVEAGVIWGQILEKINLAFVNGTLDTDRGIEHLRSVRYIVRNFNVREDDMVLIHAPLLSLAIMLHLSENTSGTKNPELRKTGLLLADEVWDLVPDVAFRSQSQPAELISAYETVDQQDNDFKSRLHIIQQFYSKSHWSSESSSDALPFASSQVTGWIFVEVASSVQQALDKQSNDIGIQCKLFVNIVQKIPRLSGELLSCLIKHLIDNFICNLATEPVPFVSLQGIANVVAALESKDYLEAEYSDTLVALIVKGLWFYLSPDVPKFHVESVKVLWNLQDVLGIDRRIEAAVATVMTDIASLDSAEPGRKFAVLWMHSVSGLAGDAYHLMLTRPLFIFLDALNEDGVDTSVFAQGWLQNLGSINRLFWILAMKLMDCEFIKYPGKRDAEGAPLQRHTYVDDDFLEIATYYFHTLLNVLRYSTNHVLATLASELVIASDDSTSKALIERGYGDEDITLQTFFTKTALRVIEGDAAVASKTASRVAKLHKMALGVLHQLLLSPYAKALADLALEEKIAVRLVSLVEKEGVTYVQVALLDVLHAALKLSVNRPTSYLGHLRVVSQSSSGGPIGGSGGSGSGIPGVVGGRLSTSGEAEKAAAGVAAKHTAPQMLLRCLVAGFSHASSRPVLDSWIFFLGECLPLVADVIFQMLLPLVECLCTQITATFQALQRVLRAETTDMPANATSAFSGKSPESTLVALLNGLEQILAVAHARLLQEESQAGGGGPVKNPDAPSSSAAGFFGSMVSGVFAVESPHSHSTAANNRLTVLLCFQDTVKICHTIWTWGDTSSTSAAARLDAASRDSWAYTSQRMKGRARRILEHMFAAETLECLETLIELWPGRVAPVGERHIGSIFRLVNVLDGSRPKHTVPAIFNAIYSRTNPQALDPARRSTMTAALTDMDVVVFLVEYASSLEDDAMDEIWADCMVFLRDVLANPFPHRQTLPSLLRFAATLGEKVDNTNFGEQRRMRKELADLFLRMLTAAFTVTPVGGRTLELPTSQSSSFTTAPASAAPGPSATMTERERATQNDDVAVSPPRNSHPHAHASHRTPPDRTPHGRTTPDDILAILISVVPSLRKVLVDPDRVVTASVTIFTSLISPTFRSKAFPSNVSMMLLTLVRQLTHLPNNQKAWKRELSDAFMDARFFLSPTDLVDDGWVPISRQYILSDRDRMTDLLSRITPPAAAGVLFGVGATSARAEADRRTCLNLKRIAFLIYSAATDTFVPNLSELEEKLVELLSATAISSPSSAGTRSDLYLLFRALALRTSAVHLSSLWPLINTELHSALVALLPGADPEHTYTDAAILHAAKLLDTLLVLAPDEFQLHEWLFVTDTIEAVYHPIGDWNPTALVDQVALDLPGSTTSASTGAAVGGGYEGVGGSGRKPWFGGREERSENLDLRRDCIAPFLRNLSIRCYEGTYAMSKPDTAACEKALVADLFEDFNTIGAV